MSYLAVRYLHITCVVLTVSLFIIRGGLQFAGAPWRDSRFLRIAPHSVDSVLLLAAITLAVMSGQYPFQQSWLTAKLFGLLAYIGLGHEALARQHSPMRRVGSFVGALIAVSYIIGTAITRSPTWGFL
ncbi:MAG: SirB2 family protein [Betaproteobacteria bacterium]|nr:SirB2 family protein [Betaproteobacteria bacterium]